MTSQATHPNTDPRAEEELQRLIDGLSTSDPEIWYTCIMELRDRTGETFVTPGDCIAWWNARQDGEWRRKSEIAFRSRARRSIRYGFLSNSPGVSIMPGVGMCDTKL